MGRKATGLLTRGGGATEGSGIMLNIGSNTSILASASFLAPDPVDSLPPAVRSGRPRTGKRSDGLPPEWVVAHHHRDFQSKRAYAPLFAHVAQSRWIRDTELENRTFDQFIATDRIRALVLDGRQAEE